METVALFVPISISLGLFAMIFGIVYMHKKQKLAMIERGMDPRAHKPYPAPYRNLTWGLLLIGSGLGLFIAYVLDHTAFKSMDDNNFFMYIALVAVFGGTGLFISYRIEKMEILDKNPQYFE
jgi:H+/Cl- antiporter ClcA